MSMVVVCILFRQPLKRLPSRQQDQAAKTLSAGNADTTSQAAPCDAPLSAADKTSASAGASSNNTTSSSGRSRFLLSRSVSLPSLCYNLLLAFAHKLLSVVCYIRV